MTGWLLLVVVAGVGDEHKALDAALAAGRFAEVEQRSRALIKQTPHAYPAALSRLVRALAEQGKCKDARAALTNALPDRFLAAQLDTAAGDFAAARKTLSAALQEARGDGGHDPSLADGFALLSLLDLIAGDEVAATATSATGLSLREKPLYPDPFDRGVSLYLLAHREKRLAAWTDGVKTLEQVSGPHHPLVRFGLEQRAALLEASGKKKEAAGDRARAAAARPWCQ